MIKQTARMLDLRLLNTNLKTTAGIHHAGRLALQVRYAVAMTLAGNKIPEVKTE